jgi:hypothetical protein
MFLEAIVDRCRSDSPSQMSTAFAKTSPACLSVYAGCYDATIVIVVIPIQATRAGPTLTPPQMYAIQHRCFNFLDHSSHLEASKNTPYIQRKDL